MMADTGVVDIVLRRRVCFAHSAALSPKTARAFRVPGRFLLADPGLDQRTAAARDQAVTVARYWHALRAQNIPWLLAARLTVDYARPTVVLVTEDD
jgi:hypothetical protein